MPFNVTATIAAGANEGQTIVLWHGMPDVDAATRYAREHAAANDEAARTIPGMVPVVVRVLNEEGDAVAAFAPECAECEVNHMPGTPHPAEVADDDAEPDGDARCGDLDAGTLVREFGMDDWLTVTDREADDDADMVVCADADGTDIEIDRDTVVEYRRAAEVGACIITDANTDTEDDCTTHDHETPADKAADAFSEVTWVTVTLEFSTTEEARNALAYIGESDAPVCVESGEVRVERGDGSAQTMLLWDEQAEILAALA